MKFSGGPNFKLEFGFMTCRQLSPGRQNLWSYTYLQTNLEYLREAEKNFFAFGPVFDTCLIVSVEVKKETFSCIHQARTDGKNLLFRMGPLVTIDFVRGDLIQVVASNACPQSIQDFIRKGIIQMKRLAGLNTVGMKGFRWTVIL